MSKKRRDSVFTKIVNAVLGEPIPTAAQATSSEGVRHLTDLPASYDDTPLTGDRYINGRCCRTVGDLKEAEREDPTMGGWSG